MDHVKAIFLSLQFAIGQPLCVHSSFRWYEWWEQSGFFAGDSKSDKPPFVIVGDTFRVLLEQETKNAE